MENAIRPPRAHFHLLFCWKSNLGLSWRHLGGILGRPGKIFGPSWDPKTPPRCPKINQNRPQEPPQRRLEGVLEACGRSLVTKKRPRAAQNPPDLDFGASRPGFWRFFWRILARFLVDLIHMFYHCSKFLQHRVCMKLNSELYHFESSFSWQSASRPHPA